MDVSIFMTALPQLVSSETWHNTYYLEAAMSRDTVLPGGSSYSAILASFGPAVHTMTPPKYTPDFFTQTLEYLPWGAALRLNWSGAAIAPAFGQVVYKLSI